MICNATHAIRCEVALEFVTSAAELRSCLHQVGEDGPLIDGALRARVIPDECYWLIDQDGDVPMLKVRV